MNERADSATRHRIVNPESLVAPSGYSHAVVAAPGRTIYLAGQTAHVPGEETPEDIVKQFDRAARKVVIALETAGGRPDDLVSMQIFTTDLADYLSKSKEVGDVYQKHFGKHYPAAALIEVKSLVGGAKVELSSIAVVPEGERG
ncbi:MAG TPA: RidA family protein [Actinomycetota bacterium]|nr:RidA family protein [Actinomycetota bacterium]